MAMTVEEEAASPVAEAHPQEARQEAITQEAFPEEAHQEEAHQEAALPEEDIPAHFREGDAHKTIGQTSSYWRNLDRTAEA